MSTGFIVFDVSVVASLVAFRIKARNVVCVATGLVSRMVVARRSGLLRRICGFFCYRLSVGFLSPA